MTASELLCTCSRCSSAKTLHPDGICQSCRGGASHRNSESALESCSDRMFEMNRAGTSSAGFNSQGQTRYRRGFAMMDGVTA